MGFRSRRLMKVPSLNAHHLVARLAWARKHRGCSVEDWGVFFRGMDVLKQGMKGHHTAPTNLIELWTALANIWQVPKLVESMLHRVAVVIKDR
ncbi:hypothetical protein TNCV_1075921 [Trichonephila clavipes]|uniref:Uncharacterized protein n=1 Tax=Trichonephila clavipes TaxID=2585209 RepID=A0A8X6VGL4_TRICX|nr:hypothetical protein TNCV_1075921 [Trichonephila clavipes]